MKNKKDTKQKKGIIASTRKGKVKAKKQLKKKTMKVKEKHYTDCRQKQCGYFQNGGCQKCEECGAEPNKVEDTCQTCFDCENKPDALRWDNKGDNSKLSNEDKINMKEAFEKAISQLNKNPKKKQLILNNGEIENEKKDNNISKDNFEKELKQEILKKIAEQMMSGMTEQMPGMFQKETKEKCEEEPKKKNVSYIGYEMKPKDEILSSFFSPYSIYKQKKSKTK